MDKSYKVSIGVPVYNAAKYIKRCVKSILSQSYENLEVLFVDDCSTDNSVNVIENTINDFPKRKDQVRIIRHERNQGVSVARNTFLDNLTGDFVMFVDADDYLTTDAILKLMDQQRRTDSDLTSGTFLMDDGNNQDLYREDSNNVDAMLQRCCGISRCHNNFARIFRAKLLENPSLRYRPNVKIGEDWIFMVEALLRMERLSYIDDVVYIYDYTNQGSAMHNINYGKIMLAETIALHEIKQLVKVRSESYVNSTEKLMAERIEEGLLIAYRSHDRALFRDLKKYINELSSTNIDDSYHFKKVSIGSFIYPESYALYFWLKRNYYKLKMKHNES